jgi:hypothetical protein
MHLDYLVVFLSLVVGYVVTEFFSGWRTMIRRRRSARARPTWVHIGWSLLLFLLLIQNWWGNAIDIASIGQNFLLFCLALVTPAFFYLFTIFLFPEEPSDGELDYQTHFHENRDSLYCFVAAMIASYIPMSMWTASETWYGLGNVLRVIAIGAILFARSKNSEKWPWRHEALLVVLWLLLITYIVCVRWTLSSTTSRPPTMIDPADEKVAADRRWAAEYCPFGVLPCGIVRARDGA